MQAEVAKLSDELNQLKDKVLEFHFLMFCSIQVVLEHFFL